MNKGIVSFDEVMELAYVQVPNPRGVLSIFSGGVFWESVDQFEESCAQNPEHAIDRLLEVRVYSDDCEFHAVRDSIDGAKKLSWRTANDEFFDGFADDDVQYLDINAKASDPANCVYQTSSGGRFTLPVSNAERIVLRNYYRYDNEGLAHFVDFRIVRLVKEGE